MAAAADLTQDQRARLEQEHGYQSQPKSSLIDVPGSGPGHDLEKGPNEVTPQANDRKIQMVGTNQQLLFTDDEGKDQ